MRRKPGSVFLRSFLGVCSILFAMFFLCSLQDNAFAVLKAEGGKEIVVADPLKGKGTKKETTSSAGFTSRIPRSMRASASTDSDGTVPQQSNALPAQSGTEFSQSRTINYQTSVASNAQPLIISATMKPTTVSPPLQSLPEPVKPVSQPSRVASSSNPAETSSSPSYRGCILGGTLVNDITLDVCNSKGGKPLMTGGSGAAPTKEVAAKT